MEKSGFDYIMTMSLVNGYIQCHIDYIHFHTEHLTATAGSIPFVILMIS